MNEFTTYREAIQQTLLDNRNYARNYINFLGYWFKHGKSRTSAEILADEFINNRRLLRDTYSMRCFNPELFQTTGYTYEDIDNYFTTETRWELKRGFGLTLEYSLVSVFEDSYIPCIKRRTTGRYAYDFIYKSDGWYYPLDLKMGLGQKASYHKNVSIFNIDVMLPRQNIINILEAMSVKDNLKYFVEFQKINDTIKKSKDKRAFKMDLNENIYYKDIQNKKSFNDCQSLKL